MTRAPMHIAFFAEQLYYLPQFTPVIRALLARGHRVTTVLRLEPSLSAVPLPLVESLGPSHALRRVDSSEEAYRELRHLAPAWAVFGSFLDPQQALDPATRTALVYHGIGVKNVLFDPRLDAFDLRCVESQRVLDELVARDASLRDRLALVGFAKLDPLFGGASAPPPDGPPVLLYAPTFYPSSLELMPHDLKALAPGAHWIVKPHFFSWTAKPYEAHRRRLRAWREAGIEVLGPEAYDLVPLMARADVLISDASSALFEFAALRRPVVWCHFLKLRWTYRGLLAFRLRKRLDPNAQRYETVAHRVDTAAQLPAVLQQALAERRMAASAIETPERAALIEHLIGPRDGQASQRIVEALEARAGAPLVRRSDAAAG